MTRTDTVVVGMQQHADVALIDEDAVDLLHELHEGGAVTELLHAGLGQRHRRFALDP